jgi:hypothetical protein
MYRSLLADVNFFALLQKVDLELAESTRQLGCPHCGCAIHQANYARKPRGGPSCLEGESATMVKEADGAEWKLAYDLRFSLCCGEDGCRRRVTPPSVRFLGRRFYLGVVVVLAAAMLNGATSWRVRRLQELLPISRRTLARWRAWWLVTFVGAPLWLAARSRWMPPLAEAHLPASLLDGFPGDAGAKMVACLRLLEPLTTKLCPPLVTPGSPAW